MNSKINYLLVLILCVNGLMFSQENSYEKRSFPMYSNSLSKIYNISCRIPDSFTDLKFLELLKIDQNYWEQKPYCPVIQSDDKDCILMYFFVPQYSFLTRNLIKGEIKWMQGINCCSCSNNDTIDIENYATVITGNYAKTAFNADSVIFMDIPLETPFKGKYTYCTSMLITKKDHATMVLKWFFTDTGKKNQDKYIKSLSKNIWYNEGSWSLDSKESVISILNFLGPVILDKKQ